MDRTSMLAFVRFHGFANERILTTASALTEEEFRAPGPLDHGTAFDTLRHLVDVDWSWREFCTGNDVGETDAWEHGYALDDLAGIRVFCAEEDARLRAYIDAVDDAELEEPLSLDETTSVPRWLIVAHIVNHGTQHRSELARYMTDLGHSPGELDLLDAIELP
jgi:uncharacterized damage-inducible protein DinB